MYFKGIFHSLTDSGWFAFRGYFDTPKKKIVIVNGAGGLELATCLGNKLGHKRKAAITLVDRSYSHLWKPLLHEVATSHF